MADRVSYRVSRKVSDGDYGSVEYSFHYETDVAAGETPKGAMERSISLCDLILKEKLYALMKKIRPAKGEAPPPPGPEAGA